ncbi:MAG: peptide ABC transporter substrate-binding protein [Actinobacteria bacterium]|jgi:peptide/nickel transport system substrate-binding protein|nr:ABC transporter substrate-binding protein [Actinomycetota bacterium]PLS84979.1 MAG: peptide ABC transporter substrate-binding protein [Actinomycetota bacterium]
MGADPLNCVWLDTREDRTDRVVLTAFEDHWNKERGPRLEKVIFRNDISPAEALDLVCTTEGQIDLVTEVAPADAEKVQNSEYAKLEVIDSMRILLGLINRGAEDAPLHDKRARKALNLAVDRARLVSEAFNGYAHQSAGVIPAYAGGYPGNEPYPHDPGEAKRLLQEAGWPEGRPLRLATTTSTEGVARMLEGDLRESLGIDVEVMVVPDEGLLAAQHALVEKVMALPFDVLLHAWIDLSADAPPAFMHHYLYSEGGPFRTGPPVAEFDRLMGQFAKETDAERQSALSAEIDRFVYDEVLSLFLVAPQALYAVNKNVNFVAHATTLELAETYVTEEHWSRKNGS